MRLTEGEQSELRELAALPPGRGWWVLLFPQACGRPADEGLVDVTDRIATITAKGRAAVKMMKEKTQ